MNVTMTSVGYNYVLTKTLQISPSRMSYGESYVSILEKNDHVKKRFHCMYQSRNLLHLQMV